MDPDAQAVVEHMCQAMVKGDAGELYPLFTDDMRLIHMTGTVQNKEEFLSGMSDGTFVYHGIKVVSIDGRDDGRTAEVRLRPLTDATVYGGSRHVWRLESELRLRKESARWQIYESRVTTF